MKCLTQLYISFLLMLTLFSCENSREENAIENELNFPTEIQIQKIDSVCRSFIDKGNTIGFSLGLSHNGKVIFSKGYGLANIALEKTATDSTIYPIASISKFITAITTMKLVEDGKLSLEDKVIDHIPDLPNQEYMEEITISHLLRHQSGLVDHEDWLDSIYINEKRVFTDKELLAFLDKPLFFRPGSHYQYSNAGYAILSRILEKQSRKSFHQTIQSTISEPLGSASIGMWPELWNSENATMGYELADKKVDTSFHMMTRGMKGDGGLSASVLDLLALMEGVTNEKLIKKSSLEQMLTPTPVGNITVDYGLGVRWGKLKGQKTFGHSGGYKGTGWAMLTHYPDTGFTFAAAMNTNFSPEEIWTLRDVIMPVVLDIEPPILETSPIKNIEQYSGTYYSGNRWGNAPPNTRIVSHTGDSLFWDNPTTETPPTQLFPVGKHTFGWKPYPYDEFKFHEVDGKIVACSQYLDGSFIGLWMKE